MEQPVASSTKESPGPYDALGKALPGEPIFPLKASDPDAPDTILHWADLRRRRARRIDQPEVRRAELAQCSNAEACAWEFEDWRKREIGEAAEEPQTVRVNYSGVKKSAAELDAAERFKAIRTAVAELREAAFHFCEARDILVSLGELPSQGIVTARSVADILAQINEVADHFTPQRHG